MTCKVVSAQAPPEEAKPLFLQYAALEEQHGLARSAMEVYDKAVKTVPVKERLSVYELYLARAHEYFGLGKVRSLRQPSWSPTFPFSYCPAPRPTLLLSAAFSPTSTYLLQTIMKIVQSCCRWSRFQVSDVKLPSSPLSEGSAGTEPAVCWGSAQVREIYETAIEEQEEGGLSDEDCKRMCLRYAALERRLGEIDRGRAIYVHASSLADPRTDPAFWADWNAFEVKHGNEDTFRCGHRLALRLNLK